MIKLKDFYNKIMSEFRCSECNKLFFKAKLHGDYHIEIVCPRCKSLNVLERKSQKKTGKLA